MKTAIQRASEVEPLVIIKKRNRFYENEARSTKPYSFVISPLSSCVDRARDKKAKVAFVIAELSFRGIEVSTFDYAHYNETILGNESIIINFDIATDNEVRKKFNARFSGKFFDCCSLDEMDYILDQELVDILYFQKPGHNDGVLSKVCKNAVHVVFPTIDIHGDAYAFISEWFVEKFPEVNKPFVPYLVRVEDTQENLRAELGVPEDALVFGRHGGFDSFNVPCAVDAVKEVAEKRPDIYFIFLNTKEFCHAPNVIFLPKTTDMLYKAKFINTCDAMLHARWRGETFGLACAEFSIKNKPVITWSGSNERSHINILGDKALYYGTKNDLIAILTSFQEDSEKNWDAYSSLFAPEVVMKKFDEVFIQPLLTDKDWTETSKKLSFQAAMPFGMTSYEFMRELWSLFNPEICIAPSYLFPEHCDFCPHFFKQVHVVAPNSYAAEQARQQVARWGNITVHTNFDALYWQSRDVIVGSALVMIDGGEGAPIADTVSRLLAMIRDKAVLVIQDVLCLDDGLADIYQSMKSRGYQIFVMVDTIIAFNHEDVFVAPLIKAMTISRFSGVEYIKGGTVSELLAAEQMIGRLLADQQAMDDFDFISMRASWSPYYRLWRGLALYNQGNYEKSAALFEELIMQGYGHWRLFWYWGKALHKMGDVRAEQAVLHVLSVVPQFNDALTFKKEVSA